jgi:hypothetical protein
MINSNEQIIMIFSHFLAYLESMRADPFILANDRINLDKVKKLWKIVTKFLEPYNSD